MRPIKFMHQPVKRVCVRRHVKTRRGGSHFIQLWDPFLPKSRKEVVSSVDWQSGSMRRGWKLYTFKRHSDPKHPAQLDAEELSSRLEGLDGENHRFYITHTHILCIWCQVLMSIHLSAVRLHVCPCWKELCWQSLTPKGGVYFETSVLRNTLTVRLFFFPLPSTTL